MKNFVTTNIIYKKRGGFCDQMLLNPGPRHKAVLKEGGKVPYPLMISRFLGPPPSLPWPRKCNADQVLLQAQNKPHVVQGFPNSGPRPPARACAYVYCGRTCLAVHCGGCLHWCHALAVFVRGWGRRYFALETHPLKKRNLDPFFGWGKSNLTWQLLAGSTQTPSPKARSTVVYPQGLPH